MKKPIYLQIAEQLIDRITTGELPPESILPTENDLQTEFAVSRITIRKAMKVLVDKDLVYRQRGNGTYVKAAKVQHDVLHLNGFVEEISKKGKTPSSKIITFEIVSAGMLVAQKLNLNPGDEVYSIRRLRLIDNEPEVLEHTFLPVALFPDLSIAAMRSSKYDYIENTKGMKIKLSRQSIKAENIDEQTAKLLNMKTGAAVVRVDATGELNKEVAFEYSIHYFRGYQYSFDYVSYRQ